MKISAMLVIPVKHKWSDSIFIADDQNHFYIYRPSSKEKLETLYTNIFPFLPPNPYVKAKINYGLDHSYYGNDTEGYIYYLVNFEIAIIRLSERKDGFHEVSFETSTLPPTTTCMTHVPRPKSKYK